MNKIDQELNMQFPIGDKARGRALIIATVANMELESAQAQARLMLHKFMQKFDLGAQTDDFMGQNYIINKETFIRWLNGELR